MDLFMVSQLGWTRQELLAGTSQPLPQVLLAIR